MHILLGTLALLVTLLILLHRLADAGIDLGGLNPFLWKRRRDWRKQVEGSPAFRLSAPKDIAGVLVAGVAKVDGEMSAEEKRAVLREFEATLGLGSRGAAELLGSSAYLLGDGTLLADRLDAFLRNASRHVTPDQAGSVLAMMGRVANATGTPSAEQLRLIDATRAALTPPQPPAGVWR